MEQCNIVLLLITIVGCGQLVCAVPVQRPNATIPTTPTLITNTSIDTNTTITNTTITSTSTSATPVPADLIEMAKEETIKISSAASTLVNNLEHITPQFPTNLEPCFVHPTDDPCPANAEAKDLLANDTASLREFLAYYQMIYSRLPCDQVINCTGNRQRCKFNGVNCVEVLYINNSLDRLLNILQQIEDESPDSTTEAALGSGQDSNDSIEVAGQENDNHCWDMTYPQLYFNTQELHALLTYRILCCDLSKLAGVTFENC